MKVHHTLSLLVPFHVDQIFRASKGKNLAMVWSKPCIFRVLQVGPINVRLRFLSSGRTNLVLHPLPLILKINLHQVHCNTQGSRTLTGDTHFHHNTLSIILTYRVMFKIPSHPSVNIQRDTVSNYLRLSSLGLFWPDPNIT